MNWLKRFTGLVLSVAIVVSGVALPPSAEAATEIHMVNDGGSLQRTFWGNYGGNGGGSTADGGYNTTDGKYFFAKNRYLDIGYAVKTSEYSLQEWIASNWADDFTQYVSLDGQTWYQTYPSITPNTLNSWVKQTDIPIPEYRYVRASVNSYLNKATAIDSFAIKLVPINAAPTITVSQSGDKSINLKSGSDTFTLTGTVSDADNDTLSVTGTIGGITKQVVVSNSRTPKTWTLTWRTSEFTSEGVFTGIQIIADDGRGGVATSNYSGSLTIDKTPLFYWDKYSIKDSIVYSEEPQWQVDFSSKETIWDAYSGGGYISYSFDPVAGKYSIKDYDSSSKQVGTWYYSTSGGFSGTTLYRYRIVNAVGQYIWVSQDKKGVRSIPTQVKDQLMQANILDLDGSYPDDGIHSDGYWYVKKSTTNMFPVLSVDSSDIVANQSAGKITLKGTASDSDGDTVTITATLAGVVKSTSVTGSGSWQLEWPLREVPEGIYSGISITGNDGNEGIDTITYTGTITVDKTPPVVTVTPDQQFWTSDPINLSIQWSDQLSGIDTNERKYKLSNSQTAPASWDSSNADQLDLNIPSEGEWYLHAKALDNAGNEATTVAGPFQSQLQPEVPNLKMNAVGADWAEVGWSLPSGSFADGYSYTIENTVTGQSWTVDYPTDHVREVGLNAGSAYQYRIKAKNHVGESAWSEQFEVLTLPGAVKNLKVKFVPYNSSTVNVSFDGVASAESYLLTIKEGANLAYEEELSVAGTYQVAGIEAGKQYTASVTAGNASGYGQSSTLGFLSLPAAPGEFRSAQIWETEVELSWNASPTASLYELLRDAMTRYSGADLSFKDTGLESGTEYDYQLAAKNESGFGDFAYLNGVLTLPGKTEIAVDGIGKDEVTLSIKNVVRGVEKYQLLVNGVIEKDLPAGTNQFKVDSLASGTEYTFEVYAENRSGAGVSDRVTVHTLPDKPQGVMITDISETSAKLSWEPVQGADKYKISLTDDVYFETSGTNVVLNDLLSGKVYLPKVFAGNASGYGEAATGTFLTLPTSPEVRLESVQSDNFTVVWAKVPSATGYVLYGDNNQVIGETEETSYTITGLKPGETRTIYAAAVNETGEGSKSSFTQRTLPEDWVVDPSDPEASQPISIGDRGEHSVVIVVEPVEGADQYKIVDGDGNIVGIITAPETAKEIGGLESAKEYNDWTIIPINDAGEGQAASVPPFLTMPSTNFTVSVGNPTTSSLTINVDSQLTNEIFVYTQSGKELYRGKDKAFTVRKLEADQSYTFQVWAENSDGDKTVPKSATGQTLPVPLSGGSGGGGSIPMKPEPPKPESPAEEIEPMNPNTDESQPGTRKPGFQDIGNSFAKNEILALYEKGIVKGVSETSFEPDRKVTRVEFASMLVRALELQEASDAALTFEDIQRTAWYTPELSTAVLNGVAKGFSEKEFRPFAPITREQAAKMIANAAYKGSLPTTNIRFRDANMIAVWAKPEVAALTTEQVITGYPDQTFRPKRDLTRAECAALIYRLLGLLN
ncbi:S-layer homology domain-containing protein [Paenibacillus cisolokensis]|uniref:fibronectin type III domain-containing protein n=1 Tax=Paenibacillus cisolokensis TaxID=1658519 RepID=UPI003D2AC4F9